MTFQHLEIFNTEKVNYSSKYLELSISPHENTLKQAYWNKIEHETIEYEANVTESYHFIFRTRKETVILCEIVCSFQETVFYGMMFLSTLHLLSQDSLHAVQVSKTDKCVTSINSLNLVHTNFSFSKWHIVIKF